MTLIVAESFNAAHSQYRHNPVTITWLAGRKCKELGMPESRSGKDIQAIVGQATNVATQCLSLPQTTKPASGWKAHVQLTIEISGNRGVTMVVWSGILPCNMDAQ